MEPLLPLGLDVLQFLGACVVITPVCKKLKVSPILGFLIAGVALRQFKCVPLLRTRLPTHLRHTATPHAHQSVRRDRPPLTRAARAAPFRTPRS